MNSTDLISSGCLHNVPPTGGGGGGGDLKEETHVSHSSGGWRAKVKVLADLIPGVKKRKQALSGVPWLLR